MQKTKEYVNLIEAVEVSLSLSMVDNPGLLKKIGFDVATLCIELVVIFDVHVLSL